MVDYILSTSDINLQCVGTIQPFCIILSCLSDCRQLLTVAESNIALQEFLRSHNPNQQHSATLESFLIKPIQRILKYPLLLRQLTELTDPSSSEHAHLRGPSSLDIAPVFVYWRRGTEAHASSKLDPTSHIIHSLGRPDGLLFYRRCIFFFVSPLVLRDPSTDRPETLPHGRNLNFIIPLQNSGGAPPKKFGGQKHAKFRSILDHFRL